MADVHLCYEKCTNPPAICMRCGAPASFLLEWVFSTSPWWTVLFIVIGFLPACMIAFVLTTGAGPAWPLLLVPITGFFPYFVIDLIFRLIYRMKMEVPLCKQHRYHFALRSLGFFGGWLTAIAAFLLFGYFLLATPGFDPKKWLPLVATGTVGAIAILVVCVSSLGGIKAYGTTTLGMTVCGVPEEFAKAYESSVNVEEDRERLGTANGEATDDAEKKSYWHPKK